MLPLISFETGRRKRTQSSDQDHSLILETANGSLVLFSNRNHGPRGQRSALKNPRVCTRAPPKRVGRAFFLWTKTYHGSRLTGHVRQPRSSRRPCQTGVVVRLVFQLERSTGRLQVPPDCAVL